ncbi:MAG: DUF2510 domain-containing protein [Thermoleophilia bacterium]|nr:DUF2510 domain-containing protein [Thermoleophilia bacterium]
MSSEQTTSGGPVAGWYPDPLEQADLRWYDGSTWTEQTRAMPTEQETGAASDPAATATATVSSSDAELLAQIRADERRRMLLIGGVVLVVLLAIGGWLLLRGDDTATTANDAGGIATAPTDSSADVGSSASSVEGEPVAPEDPQAVQAAAARQDAVAIIDSVNRAMRSCQVSTPDGSFKGCDAKALIKVAPSLKPALDLCGKPGGACVKPIGGDGYQVRAMDTAQSPITWIEIHAAGDSITRTCEPAGCTASGTWDPDETA